MEVPEAVEALKEVAVVLAKSCFDVHDETTYFYPPKKSSLETHLNFKRSNVLVWNLMARNLATKCQRLGKKNFENHFFRFLLHVVI